MEEKSKCCGDRASWNFVFKYCNKCGKRFEPIDELYGSDESIENEQIATNKENNYKNL